MPSKPSFQGQQHLLILYLYLFMLINKWRKGKRSKSGQTACGPARQGCVQWLWAPKVLRTLQCTSGAYSASVLFVFGCFFKITKPKNGLGWKGSYCPSHCTPCHGQGCLPRSRVFLRIIWKNQIWPTPRLDISAIWRVDSFTDAVVSWWNPGFLQISGWKILFICNYSLSSLLYWSEPCSQQTL